jgi:hypothetical protein
MIVPKTNAFSTDPTNPLFSTARQARLWIAECVLYAYLELSLEVMSPEELVRRDTANCLKLIKEWRNPASVTFEYYAIEFDNSPSAMQRKLGSSELRSVWPSIEYRIGKETGLLRQTLATALAETGLTLRGFMRQAAEVA